MVYIYNIHIGFDQVFTLNQAVINLQDLYEQGLISYFLISFNHLVLIKDHWLSKKSMIFVGYFLREDGKLCVRQTELSAVHFARERGVRLIFYQEKKCFWLQCASLSFATCNTIKGALAMGWDKLSLNDGVSISFNKIEYSGFMLLWSSIDCFLWSFLVLIVLVLQIWVIAVFEVWPVLCGLLCVMRLLLLLGYNYSDPACLCMWFICTC